MPFTWAAATDKERADWVRHHYSFNEAVDEIERLRAVIKNVADKIDAPTRCPRVEIVRELRAALQK